MEAVDVVTYAVWLPDAIGLKRSLDATAWRVDDTKDLNPDLPIGVVALPPKESSDGYPRSLELYNRARRIFDGLGAQLIDAAAAQEWVAPLVARIPVHGDLLTPR